MVLIGKPTITIDTVTDENEVEGLRGTFSTSITLFPKSGNNNSIGALNTLQGLGTVLNEGTAQLISECVEVVHRDFGTNFDYPELGDDDTVGSIKQESKNNEYLVRVVFKHEELLERGYVSLPGVAGYILARNSHSSNLQHYLETVVITPLSEWDVRSYFSKVLNCICTHVEIIEDSNYPDDHLFAMSLSESLECNYVQLKNLEQFDFTKNEKLEKDEKERTMSAVSVSLTFKYVPGVVTSDNELVVIRGLLGRATGHPHKGKTTQWIDFSFRIDTDLHRDELEAHLHLLFGNYMKLSLTEWDSTETLPSNYITTETIEDGTPTINYFVRFTYENIKPIDNTPLFAWNLKDTCNGTRHAELVVKTKQHISVVVKELDRLVTNLDIKRVDELPDNALSMYEARVNHLPSY